MTRWAAAGRSVGAIVLGMAAITFVVEGIEFVLVALVNGGILTDPEPYLAIRNQPLFLAAKMLYNTTAAAVGGRVSAVVAGRSPLLHAGVLAAAQTAGFGFALLSEEMRSTGPLWMWLTLAPLSAAGIFLGAADHSRSR